MRWFEDGVRDCEAMMAGWIGRRSKGFRHLVLASTCWAICACKVAPKVHPIIAVPVGFKLRDVSFHSNALGRDVTYRSIRPTTFSSQTRVIYLLHGNGSGFREWSEFSDLVRLLGPGYVLVMPEGGSTYFMNSAGKTADRYEDFLAGDLIADAERGLPVSPGRADRAIVGVSMGGFAAIVLGLKHPELYCFVGALSPPVDYPERGFTFRRLGQSLGIRSIFGPTGSATRLGNDPFVLVRTVDASKAPYVFLAVGEQEGLAEPVRRFEASLARHGFAHAFQTEAGGHDWRQWNAELPGLVGALKGRIH